MLKGSCFKKELIKKFPKTRFFKNNLLALTKTLANQNLGWEPNRLNLPKFNKKPSFPFNGIRKKPPFQNGGKI